jgi:YHS domain-containing protein
MATTALDPVCGKIIDPATAAGKSTYNGVTYYFDSLNCKASFDKDPAKYTDPTTSASSTDSVPILRH